MKYIPAEKLIAEIENRLHCNGAFDEVGDSQWHYDQGMVDAYKHIKDFITSLQQEHPACETLGQEIEKVWNPYEQLGFDLTKSQFADIARHFAMWGIHTAESCKMEGFKLKQPASKE